MPFQPSVSYVGDRFLADAYGDFGRSIGSGLLAAGDRLGRGMELKAARKERADQEAADNLEKIKGYRLAVKNDPDGFLAQVMGGVDPAEIGSRGIDAMLEASLANQRMVGYKEAQSEAAMLAQAMSAYKKDASEGAPSRPFSEYMYDAGIRDPSRLAPMINVEEVMGKRAPMFGNDPVTKERLYFGPQGQRIPTGSPVDMDRAALQSKVKAAVARKFLEYQGISGAELDGKSDEEILGRYESYQFDKRQQTQSVFDMMPGGEEGSSTSAPRPSTQEIDVEKFMSDL